MVSYFEARNVTPPDPSKLELPPWFGRFMPAAREARILDIGCGHGGLIMALHRRGYVNVEGLEFDQSAAAFCQSQGLAVKQCDILSADFSRLGYFDLVIMNHVLEHLPKDKMIEIVSKIKSILTANGLYYMAVPNAQSNTGSYWAFEDFTHTLLFTSGSVYYVARMAGFERVEFVDIDCTDGNTWPVRLARKCLMAIYRAQKTFWNKVTRSTYHNESPEIFSFEIKALLRQAG